MKKKLSKQIFYFSDKVPYQSPAVEESEKPVVVLKEGEDMDGDGGADEHQVEHCKGYQQPIECMFPQLESKVFY